MKIELSMKKQQYINKFKLMQRGKGNHFTWPFIASLSINFFFFYYYRLTAINEVKRLKDGETNTKYYFCTFSPVLVFWCKYNQIWSERTDFMSFIPRILWYVYIWQIFMVCMHIKVEFNLDTYTQTVMLVIWHWLFLRACNSPWSSAEIFGGDRE